MTAALESRTPVKALRTDGSKLVECFFRAHAEAFVHIHAAHISIYARRRIIIPLAHAVMCVRVCAHAWATDRGSSKSSATLRHAPPVVPGCRLVNMRAAPGVSRFDGDSGRASGERECVE